MGLSPEAGAVIAVFLATQTGALIFYAGSVSRTLRDHERRIGIQEIRADMHSKTINQLAFREGIDV